MDVGVEVAAKVDAGVAFGGWLGKGEEDDVGVAVGFGSEEGVGAIVGFGVGDVRPLTESTYVLNAGFWFPLLSKSPKLESGMAV